MATINKDPNLTMWNKRAAKRFVDEQVFRCITQWQMTRKICNVLSLPAKEWLWERDFAVSFPNMRANFYGIERNTEVLETMRKTSQNLNKLHTHHKFLPVDQPIDALQFLQTTNDVYDFIYLDWMGTWSTEKFKQIQAVLDRDVLRKGGFLRLTMALGRGKAARWASRLPDYDQEICGVQDMRAGGGILPEWKVYGIPGLIMQEAKLRGVKLKMVSNIAYISRNIPTERGTSEMSVMFRRY
jgi:hypothetical protein